MIYYQPLEGSQRIRGLQSTFKIVYVYVRFNAYLIFKFSHKFDLCVFGLKCRQPSPQPLVRWNFF